VTEGKDLAASLFDVRGSRTLVTGAGSGLGLAMAEVMAANGARVMLSDADPESLQGARKSLADRGGDVAAHPADVADAEQVESLAARTREEFGGIDVVFANAGINSGRNLGYPDGAIESFPVDAWEKVMAIDLGGVFNTLRACAPVMKEQGSGSIIVTASTAGLRAEPLMGYAYVAAKAAVVNLVRQAALELCQFGVRVNAIAPGSFATNIGATNARAGRVQSRAYGEVWLRTIPMGRTGQPDEIKGISLLLASRASSFVTGSVWTIDGGATALTQGGIPDYPDVRAPRPGSAG
jgi:NAD(P)-dependent dehydrogenase (short-subunit alcohol dehydrogenase family)